MMEVVVFDTEVHVQEPQRLPQDWMRHISPGILKISDGDWRGYVAQTHRMPEWPIAL